MNKKNDFNKKQLNHMISKKHNIKSTKNNLKTKNTASKPTLFQKWRRRAGQMINERLEVESKGVIIFKFFAGILIGIIVIFLLFLFLDFQTFTILGGWMLAYFFPPLGKESVIPLGIGSGLDPFLIAMSIAFIDIVVALFLLWNYDFAKLIPFLGPWMIKVEKKGGKKFQESPWLENLAFFGLVLFVMFPFQGSGGVAASILGRVIGMNKLKVLFAICIGAIIGCLLIAYFSNLFIGFFKNNLYQGLAVLIALAIILAIYNGFKYFKKNETKY